MNPQTEFVLVRGPRTDSNNNPQEIVVSIQRNNGKFDFSNYAFLRMRPNINESMEEWVPASELELYNKVYGDKA